MTESTHSTGRLEAFSDGVFAIAITLLILDLRVPRWDEPHIMNAGPGVSPAAALATQLLHLWPNFLAYFTSFAVILIIWVNHHRIFTLVRRTDQAFLFWNGLVLMFVTLVPFPTGLVSEYMSHYDPGQFRVAALVYSGNAFLIAVSLEGLWRHAIRGGRLLPPGYDPAHIKQVDDEYRWGPAAYFAIFLVAFVAPWVSMGLCFALVMLFAFQGIMNWRPGRRR